MQTYTWTLHDGFRVLPDDHPNHVANPDALPAMLTQQGYTKATTGEPSIGALEIWSHAPPQPHFAYLVLITLPGERVLPVWLTNDVTMVAFYRDYGLTSALGDCRRQLLEGSS
jgi:hypothetical protein